MWQRKIARNKAIDVAQNVNPFILNLKTLRRRNIDIMQFAFTGHNVQGCLRKVCCYQKS